MHRSKRIALIYHGGHYPIVPSLIAMVNTLTENNYEIDVFCCKDRSLTIPIFNSLVTEYFLDQPYNIGTIKWKANYMFNWLPKILLQCSKRKYNLLIGVDPWGLVLAGITGKLLNIPYGYFSLELYFHDELHSPYLKILKKLESYFNKKSLFTISQDADRGELLRKENKLGEKAVIVSLPNAADGEAVIERTQYLREKFGIPGGTPIILQAGLISYVNKQLEIAKAFRGSKLDCALIFHSPKKIVDNDDYARELLNEIDNKRIFLNIESLPDSEYGQKIIKSADIGLALYDAQGLNVYTMGLSSGKIAKYLQCGIPVITSDFPTLKKWIEEFKCGETISEINQLGSAINKIILEYSEYSKRAIECFNKKYHFRKHFKNVLNYLNIACDDKD